MIQNSYNNMVRNGADLNRIGADEVKANLVESGDKDVRSSSNPDKCERLVAELREYVCLPPSAQSDYRIAWWEERESLIEREGRKPSLGEIFDGVARHAERRVRQSQMLDDIKDRYTEDILELEYEVFRRHKCSTTPTSAAIHEFRRRLQDLMKRSFGRYRVI